MGDGVESLPDDIETLKAALIVARAEAAAARARQSDDQALIAHLKLQIEKLNRDRYGPRSERTARLLDQLELTLEELESSATEDELAAEMAAAKTTKVASFTRKRPSRQPFPEHLPRERVIVPGPVVCACCGGARLSRLGEDITETLENARRRSPTVRTANLQPHQFRTTNDLTETQQTQSRADENGVKSTKLIDSLPLITVWLQARVLPVPRLLRSL